jgi:hypothetical protein
VSVGEADCIKTKYEEDYLQLVRTIKTEEEVSVGVFCGSDLFTGVCVCVCFTVYLVTHSCRNFISHPLVNACESAGCTSVIRCV